MDIYIIIYIWLWINTYRYSLLGDENPFATYFDVHQGYMVLTHSHIYIITYKYYNFSIISIFHTPQMVGVLHNFNTQEPSDRPKERLVLVS